MVVVHETPFKEQGVDMSHFSYHPAYSKKNQQEAGGYYVLQKEKNN